MNKFWNVGISSYLTPREANQTKRERGRMPNGLVLIAISIFTMGYTQLVSGLYRSLPNHPVMLDKPEVLADVTERSRFLPPEFD